MRKKISVLVLSRKREFSEALRNHLETHHPVAQLTIGFYEDVESCVKNLHLNNKDDVIVLDYEEDLAKELSHRTNGMQDFTVIHCIPKHLDESKIHFIRTGAKEYTVTGNRPFARVTKLLNRISRWNSLDQIYANANYRLAIAFFLVIIIVVIVVAT